MLSVQSLALALQCRPKLACRISHVNKHLICNNATLPDMTVLHTHLCLSCEALLTDAISCQSINKHYLHLIFLCFQLSNRRGKETPPHDPRDKKKTSTKHVLLTWQILQFIFLFKGCFCPMWCMVTMAIGVTGAYKCEWDEGGWRETGFKIDILTILFFLFFLRVSSWNKGKMKSKTNKNAKYDSSS